MAVLSVTGQGSHALEYALENPKADKEVVLAAGCQSDCALEYVSKNLKATKEVVLAAVAQDDALQFASAELRWGPGGFRSGEGLRLRKFPVLLRHHPFSAGCPLPGPRGLLRKRFTCPNVFSHTFGSLNLF